MWKTFKAEFVALWKSRLRFASWVILLFMPLIYGFLFLSSFWSPFKNTDKLPIVVVNMDRDMSDANSVTSAESNLLVKTLTNDGNDLIFNGGSSEYKINIKEASEIYSSKTEVEDKVNKGDYTAAFVIPHGYGQVVNGLKTKIITDILNTGNIDALQSISDIRAAIKPLADQNGGLIDFYNSFKVSYVAGEMTNMGSSLYRLIVDLLFPDVKQLQPILDDAKNDLNGLIQTLVKTNSAAQAQIAGSVISGININEVHALATKALALIGGLSAKLSPVQQGDPLLSAVFTKIASGLNLLKTTDQAGLGALLQKVTADVQDLKTQINSFTTTQLQPLIESLKETVLGDIQKGNLLVNHRTYGKREGVIGKHDILNTYGYGLSPYFISIVLWAGALLMVFLFPNKRYIKTEGTFKTMMGKMGVWIVTGWIQTLLLFAIIAIPGIFGSITYHFADGSAVTIKQCINLGGSEWQLILFGLFVSTMFMILIRGIMHSIRVADVGLFLGVVLLILQLTSSGGTFPAGMQPGFFQGLHKILPFTYVVNAIREIYYDPSAAVILKDCGILLIIPTIFTTTSYISNKIWDMKTKKVIDGKTYYKSMDKNIGSL